MVAYRPRTAAYSRRTAAYRPRTAAYGPHTAAYRPRTAAYRPRTAAYCPRTVAYGLRTVAYGSCTAAYCCIRPRIAAYGRVRSTYGGVWSRPTVARSTIRRRIVAMRTRMVRSGLTLSIRGRLSTYGRVWSPCCSRSSPRDVRRATYGCVWSTYGCVWSTYGCVWSTYGRVWSTYGRVWSHAHAYGPDADGAVGAGEGWGERLQLQVNVEAEEELVVELLEEDVFGEGGRGGGGVDVAEVVEDIVRHQPRVARDPEVGA